MSRTMYAGRMFDALVVENGTPQTSLAIRMDSAEAMSIQTQVATTAGSINIVYTYEVSSSQDGPFIPGNTTIPTQTALDIIGFSPEASKWIRLIATNGDAADVTLTAVLNIQEG